MTDAKTEKRMWVVDGLEALLHHPDLLEADVEAVDDAISLIRQQTAALEDTVFNLEAVANVINQRDAKALKSVIDDGKAAIAAAYDTGER